MDGTGNSSSASHPSPPPVPAAGVVAGWHPDPFGRHELRYHNGLRWTGDVSTEGRRLVDPPSSDPSTLGDSAARGDRAAVTSLVLGVIGAAIAWLPFLVAIGAVCATGALIAARRARRRSVSRRRDGHRRAGRILGIIGLVLVVPGVVLTKVVLDVLSPGPLSIQITSCDAGNGRAVLQGTITNDSDRARGYLVLVRFSREGTGGTLVESMVQIDDVDPGSTQTFAASVATDVTSVECEVIEVLGGLPFELS